MKRKIFLFCSVFLLSVLLIACGKEGGKRYDFDLSEYVSLAQYKKVEANFDLPGVCTEKEIDDAVFQILLTYADEVEKDNDIVENYDSVSVKYNIYSDGKELEEYAQAEYVIIVGYDGNGDIDAALAREMIGKKVGDTCKIEYTFPEDDMSLGSWAGVKVECTGKILSVRKTVVPECTDEMVAKIGDGFPTVAGFRQQLKEDILQQKEENKAAAVMDAFMAGVTVKKYPQMETQAYVERYIQEISVSAEEIGVSYEDYLSEYLKMTEDQISEAALKDARDRVKKDMACIQASRLLKVSLSEKEYKEGLEKYYDSEKDLFDSVEEFETYYTKDILWECIRWDKTFLLILEEAVPAK